MGVAYGRGGPVKRRLIPAHGLLLRPRDLTRPCSATDLRRSATGLGSSALEQARARSFAARSPRLVQRFAGMRKREERDLDAEVADPNRWIESGLAACRSQVRHTGARSKRCGSRGRASSSVAHARGHGPPWDGSCHQGAHRPDAAARARVQRPVPTQNQTHPRTDSPRFSCPGRAASRQGTGTPART